MRSLHTVLHDIEQATAQNLNVRLGAGYTYLKILKRLDEKHPELSGYIKLFLLVTRMTWKGEKASTLKNELDQFA